MAVHKGSGLVPALLRGLLSLDSSLCISSLTVTFSVVLSADMAYLSVRCCLIHWASFHVASLMIVSDLSVST